MLDASEIFDPFDDFGALSEKKRLLFDALSPKAQSRARWVERLNHSFVETQRYHDVNKELTRLWDNANAWLIGASSDVRLLMLTGASGSGKTTLLLKCLMDRPEWRSYRRPDGTVVRPALCFKAPKPTTPKTLLKKALGRYGVTVVRSTSEDDMMDQLSDLAQEFGTQMCVIDEMQQALRGTGLATIVNIQDTVKVLVDHEKWGLHTVVTGLPTLAKFRIGDTQVFRRSTIVELEEVTNASIAVMKKIIKNVIEVDANFTASQALYTNEFIERVFHCASYQFGTSIQVPREACANAFYRGSQTVTRDDFILVYARMTKHSIEDNVFDAKDWRHLPTPAEVMAAEAEEMRRRK